MATIVSLHAHPDDEALLTGGWLAQRVQAGDRVVLVYATDGDSGLADARYASGPAGGLGERRRAEALAAADALGIAEVRWLGYADSGMAQAPTSGANRFVDADFEQVGERLARILDREDADVLTGYDRTGGYGHPDHIQVHRVARCAAGLAARRPRLLEATMDRTWLVRGLRMVRPFARVLPGIVLPGDDVYTPRGAGLLRVDVRDQVPAKKAALLAHASQASGGIRTVALLNALPAPVARRVLGTEWFLEVRG